MIPPRQRYGPSERLLKREDIEDLARGAALLGTGGGGDPYIGRLMVEQEMRKGARVRLVSLEALDDDSFVIPTAMMGAPTVEIEKVPQGGEAAIALHALQDYLERTPFATMPVECGGLNSTIPLLVGAKLGLPVVDADGMGRAFPELQMETFHVHGVPGTPMAICDEHGDTAIIRTHSNEMMEWIARSVTIRMGGAAGIALYPMDGATVKRTAIPGTLTLCIALGRCLRLARKHHTDPFDALAAAVRGTAYKSSRVIFEGKVTDIERRTTEGFAKGRAQMASWDRQSRLELTFQNEHLVAAVDGEVVAVVPDLICVLEAETAEPITTEALRYGQRARVVVITAPEFLRTPEALPVFGPQAFGLEVEYQPSETTATPGG